MAMRQGVQLPHLSPCPLYPVPVLKSSVEKLVVELPTEPAIGVSYVAVTHPFNATPDRSTFAAAPRELQSNGQCSKYNLLPGQPAE